MTDIKYKQIRRILCDWQDLLKWTCGQGRHRWQHRAGKANNKATGEFFREQEMGVDCGHCVSTSAFSFLA